MRTFGILALRCRRWRYARLSCRRKSRPVEADTDRVFVVLKRPRRGRPLSSEGLDEILSGARRRAGLEHASCHELRHTCLTRLREAGMSLEAVQAQAGHRSIESTRVYLHLTNDWLAAEYRRGGAPVGAAIDAGAPTLPRPGGAGPMKPHPPAGPATTGP